MKEKIHYAIEAALGIAVIILFVLFFSGNKDSSQTNVVVAPAEIVSETMSIAYVDLDSLLNNYSYSIDLNEYLAKNLETSRADMAEQVNRFQKEIAEYQKKAETGSFLTRERQIAEEQRLTKKNEDLEKMQARLSQDYSDEQMRWNESMRQEISAKLKEYNKDKGYHIIYGKAGENILYAHDAYNITAEILEYLNNNYTQPSGLKPKN